MSSNATVLGKLLIIADDLTGANDTAVTFASRGRRSTIHLDAQAVRDHGGDVAAVALDTRANWGGAADITRQTVDACASFNATMLYLKVDSTMRGTAALQIRGALTAQKQSQSHAIAVVCPAFPAMGRTIENCQVLVDGIPVNDTASGKDRIAPVKTADMRELVPGAVAIPTPTSAADIVSAAQSAGTDTVIVDARNDGDLGQIAQAIVEGGEQFIPVGSAGLANALAALIPVGPEHEQSFPPVRGNKPLLAVVTSIHEASQRQVSRWLSTPQGGPSAVFSPHPEQLINPDNLPYLSKQLEGLVGATDRDVLIRANPALLENGPVSGALSTLADSLAELAYTCLDVRPFSAFILIGGDGARAVLSHLQATTINVSGALAEGVPLGTIADGQAAGTPVVTKSGGFGGPELLVEIFARLQKGIHS